MTRSFPSLAMAELEYRWIPYRTRLLVLACSLALAAGSHAVAKPISAVSADIARTSYGVVHIRAKDFQGLGYGQAYAYAQDNVCMFADSILTARGERSKFFGPSAKATKSVDGEYGVASAYLDVNNDVSDFFFKSYIDLEQLRAGYAAASSSAQAILHGYVAGYNRYLKDHGENLPKACKNAPWVRPISLDDMYLVIAEKALHASGELFARDIVNAARDVPAAPPAQRTANMTLTSAGAIDPSYIDNKFDLVAEGQLGSNGLALGRDVTASGRGMLLANPHYPWTGTDRFYQVHLTVPGKYDAMGVSLGGIPLVVIGFTDKLAWTHTVSASKHFTTFKLALDPGDKSGTSYMVDGKSEKMRSKTVSIETLMPDGSLKTASKTFYFSRHGALIVAVEKDLEWSADAAYVLADANLNNTRMLDQWLGMASASNVREFKASLDKTAGLPWVNTLVADRDGNTLFADASVVPQVSAAKFSSSCMLTPQLLMLDGARGACAWGQDGAAAHAPFLLRTDYVANSNDSYWVTNPKALLVGADPLGFSPLYGRANIEQSLRTRLGFKSVEQAIEGQPKWKLAELQGLMFANRVYAAELVLPELLRACESEKDASLLAACKVLAAWDKRNNLDSRGAILFREFWKMAVRAPEKWSIPFDKRDPIDTPRGISPAAIAPMLKLLKVAMRDMAAKNVPLDGKLGDYQQDIRHGTRVPIHGGPGAPDGNYNVVQMASGLTATGYNNVAFGASYIQVVGFDASGPTAHAILTYGQSTDPTSPYYGNQLGLYSSKQWLTLPFTPGQIRSDPHYKKTVLSQ
jgi:acyl-homoserine-lactone acylase